MCVATTSAVMFTNVSLEVLINSLMHDQATAAVVAPEEPIRAPASNAPRRQRRPRLRPSVVRCDVVGPQTFSQTVTMSGASISYPHHGRAAGFAAAVTAERSAASQSRTHLRPVNMATCYSAYELSPPQRTVQVPTVPQKDYSRPLHVDCSVEYELPNTAKPPQGVRNEPLLMIHPCYFRKIESQRRSPFINNLPPARPAVAVAAKRRMPRGQQLPQQVPQQAAQYPVQYATADRQMWEPMPPLVPISTAAAQPFCKRDQQTYSSSSGSDSGHWTDPDRSPDRPEDKHILSGKYRQYLRAHRLHPYVSSAIPLASTFPHQIQQVCYNV